MTIDNSKTTTPVGVKMEPPQPADNKPQATKSRRSVQNMNPVALQKKRENDRNAQRNIREKARNNLATLQRRIKDLESGQNDELKRRLSESEKLIQSLTALLLRHGINPEQALSSTPEHSVKMVASEKQDFSNESILEGLEMDRPTVGFQGQQYSPVSQPMYPTIPTNLHQPIVQPQPNGLGSIQYMGSPQHLESHIGSSPLVGSPLSIGHSHHTVSHTGSPQISSSPQFPVPHSLQQLRALQHMGQPQQVQFNQSMLTGSMGPMSHMARSHPMSHSQSMPLHQNSGFPDAFSSPCLSDNSHYSSPNTLIWDNDADAAYRHNISSYPPAVEHMTMV
ncbi:75f7efa9-cda6-469b-aac7-a8610e0be7c9 [Sclerotinia trifoliorum]|uniref:75f7efa9-cda6-469b-aac7-a8610e0be7c9 n=1 Tax=Sclerotinia trifoliorum TaxID=28548 RepID=A0A8H2ZRA8_9HELO|nr:75f7efa9-cda6-469b-aac7-a8610e0be7c9 [Sclerotinia trifoliorum]